jgi:cation transport ATPase
MGGTMSTEKLIAFIDVDDTLVRSIGAKRIPMPRVVERVRRLHREGAMLYLWSAGGADYARKSAQELGISDCFVAFLPKPNLIIDDQAVADWRHCKHEYPMSQERNSPKC